MTKNFAAIVLYAAMASADDRVWNYEELVAEYSEDFTANDSLTVQLFNKIEVRTEDDGQNWIVAKSQKAIFDGNYAEAFTEGDSIEVILATQESAVLMHWKVTQYSSYLNMMITSGPDNLHNSYFDSSVDQFETTNKLNDWYASALSDPEWQMIIDTETIIFGTAADQTWQNYYDAATVSAVEETISNADLLNGEPVDGSGTVYSFERMESTLHEQSYEVNTFEATGNANNFDALIYQFVIDECRSSCDTLQESCQNYEATYALLECTEEVPEEPEDTTEDTTEETTEDTTTTVTAGPMIDGTTLIFSTVGCYAASVGLLYIFKGAFA